MYGLLGKKLSHSFSKEIHHAFGNKEYELIETSDLNRFMNTTTSIGFNVTIPYKEEIIPYLDHLEGYAKQTKSVNTIVKKNNLWIGYNSDYIGFQSMLSFYDISLENKKVLIIGNGGSSKSVELVCKELNAAQVTKICRAPKNSNEITFNDIDSVKNYEIIINTTPVGMYPHNDDPLLFSLDIFSNIEVVIDLIYNPLQTKLILAAKERNILAVNGLYMLVSQAAATHEIFFNEKISAAVLKQTYMKIKKMMYNIVLIGLPLSGKSKYAKLLSASENKVLIDTDSSIEMITQKKISDIFFEEGEKQFRLYEQNFIECIYKSLNQVISTGGGMIMNSKLMDSLKQNGFIIFLDKSPEKIAPLSIKNRPLIKNANDVYQLAKERYPLYKKYADCVISIEKNTEIHLKEIEEKLYEYLSN